MARPKEKETISSSKDGRSVTYTFDLKTMGDFTEQDIEKMSRGADIGEWDDVEKPKTD